MRTVVFEDEHWQNFAPLTHTRHVCELQWGTRTLLENIVSPVNAGKVALLGREYLREVVGARLALEFNPRVDEEVLMVNARMRHRGVLSDRLKKGKKSALMSGEEVVIARVEKRLYDQVAKAGVVTSKDAKMIAKESDTARGGEELLFRNYWELVESNGLAIVNQAKERVGVASPPEMSAMKGPPSNLRISESAMVDKLVSLDASRGPIVIDEEAMVESFSRLAGPCYIGPKARIYSALVRSGTSIGEACRIGGEVENSIIMSYTNKAHLGYLGDSIVGQWVNLGASSTFSNLKNTYGTIKVDIGGKSVDSGMQKLGPVIGDMAKLSIGALVFAGRKVGTSSHLVGLAAKDIPSFTYFNSEGGASVEIRQDSAILTQRRMMERRGLELSKAEEELIKFLHGATSKDRRESGVKKGPMR